MIYKNVVNKICNYNTDALEDDLLEMGEMGYKLVSAIMAPNKYSVNVMFLFYVKEVVND